MVPLSLLSVAIPITCTSLGVWQVKRLRWKRRLLEDLKKNQDDASMGKEVEGSQLTFLQKYSLQGTLMKADKIALVGPRILNDLVGYQLVLPVKVEAALNAFPILVDFGWQPGKPDKISKDLGVFLAQQLAGKVDSQAIALSCERSVFSPKQLCKINQNLAISSSVDLNLLSEYFEVEPSARYLKLLPDKTTSRTASTPIRRSFDLRSIPNNHLQYAITWFSLAASSLLISWRLRKKLLRRK